MKKVRFLIAWVLVAAMLCTNIDYVYAETAADVEAASVERAEDAQEESDALEEANVQEAADVLEDSDVLESLDILEEADAQEDAYALEVADVQEEVALQEKAEEDFSEIEIMEDAVSADTVSVEAVNAETGENIASGTWRGMDWVIDGDGVLTISGTYSYEGEDSEKPAWQEYNERITKAKVSAKEVKSTYFWFYYCIYMQSIDLSEFDTSNVTNMSNMFHSCFRLTDLDVSKFNTSNVTNMELMFMGCSQLTSLDISNFDVSKVIYMNHMFASCPRLTSLDLGKFDTSQAQYMTGLFEGSSGLTSLDVSNFDISKVTNFSGMFNSTQLKKIKVFKNLTTEQAEKVSLPICPMYDSTGKEYTAFPANLSEGVWLYKNKIISGGHVNNDTEKGVDWAIDADGNLTVDGTGEFKTGGDAFNAPWYEDCGQIISASVCLKDTKYVSGMFRGCTSLENLDLSGFDTSSVTSMHLMFYECSKLKDLDVTKFNTSNVTNMNMMFRDCFSLTDLDLSGFDTSKVTDMCGMFSGCSKLENLDVSGFNTSETVTMATMFHDCSSLTNLDVSKFDTEKVSDMRWMFSNCSSLKKLCVSGFNTSNVTNMELMFSGCSGLTDLDVGNFNTSNVTSMKWMFTDCKGLTNLDVSNFNTGNVTDMARMFWRCSDLTALDVSSFNTNMVTSFEQMFNGNTELEKLKTFKNLTSEKAETIELPISPMYDSTGKEYTAFPAAQAEGIWLYASKDLVEKASGTWRGMDWVINGNGLLTISGTYNYEGNASERPAWLEFNDDIKKAKVVAKGVKSTSQWFYNCKYLQSIDFSVFDTSSVTDMGYMFYDCSSLSSLDVSKFDTGNVTYMGYMFYGCSGLTSLDVSKLNTGNVTFMGCMFYNCSGLTDLDLSKLDTSNVTNMGHMFHGCKGLKSLDVSKLDTGSVTDMTYMFYGCSSLADLDISNFNTKNVLQMESMFHGCSSLTSLDMSKLDTSNVVSMFQMFLDCRSLMSVDVSKLDTRNVTDMGNMFRGCRSLVSLDVSNFATSEVLKMGAMFRGCSSLTNLDISNFDTRKVTVMSDMFYGCSGLKTLDVSNLDIDNVTEITGIFRGLSGLEKLKTFKDLTTEQSDKIVLPVTPMYDSTGKEYTACPANQPEGTWLYASKDPIEKKEIASGIWQGMEWKIDLDGLLTISGTYRYAEGDIGYDQEMPDWLEFGDNIKKAKVTAKEVESTHRWFFCCESLESIDFSEFDTSSVTDMDRMFYGCSNLKDLDVSNFNTSSVTWMEFMFGECLQLTSMDLSSFDTSNVTNMGGMFFRCSGLTNLDVSNFDTSNVTNMASIFEGCTVLTSLDISNFNTGNVTNMYQMFCGCKGLMNLDVSRINTSSVSNMLGMFEDCNSLTSLDLSNFTTGKVTTMHSMFLGCSSLIKLDISNFDTISVTDMSWMFMGCKNLTSLDVSSFDTSNVTDMGSMFSSCIALTSLDVSNFNTSNVTDIGSMFWNCKSLKSLDVSHFDTTNVTHMFGMFNGCTDLTNLDVSNFNTGNVTGMGSMFWNCIGLTSLDVSNFDTSNVTSMSSMFWNCTGLSSLDVSNFNVGNVTDFKEIFGNMDSTKLEKLKTFKDLTTEQAETIALPVSPMYDSAGKEYTTFPTEQPEGIWLYASKDLIEDEPANDPAKADLETLTYSFSNSRASFGYSNPYKIPLDVFRMLFGDNVKASYYYKQQSNWGGNCMGFSATSALLFDNDNGIYPSTFSEQAAHTSDLAVVDVDQNLKINLTTFIELMQISQKAQLAQDAQNKSCVFTFDLRSGKRTLNSLYEEVKAQTERREPVIMAERQNGYGHALLAYETEEVSDEEYRIYVYDSNHPKEECYFTLSRNSEGNLISWSYDMGAVYGVWGTDSNSSLCFIPYSTIEVIWNKRGTLGEKKNTATFNSTNLSIYNGDDVLVATVKDGKLETTDENITLLQCDLVAGEGDVTDGVTILMPVDAYTVVNEDKELDSFQIEVMDTEQGAIVETTADEVVLTVTDEYGLNSVQIMAGEKDSYSVTLNSSVEGDNDNVTVTGTGLGTGEMLEVSQSMGDISVTNCNLLSITVDGKPMESASIISTAGQGGSISPSGESKVLLGGSQTYQIMPDQEYEISEVKVDGKSVGKVEEYTFKEVTTDHTIEVTFEKKVEQGEEKTSEPQPVVISVTGVTLDKASEELDVGETFVLSATVAPEDANNKKVTWSSSNQSVASVDDNGKITAKAAGETVITVTTLDGIKTASCVVKVNKKPDIQIAAQEKRTIKTVKGTATVKTWECDAPTIIKLTNKKGKSCSVTGLAKGRANLTGYDKNRNVVFEQEIRVEAPELADQVVRSGEGFLIKNLVTGTKYTEPTKYKSSKGSVLKVNPKTGEAVPKKNGKAKVTVWYGNRKIVSTFEVQMPAIKETKATVKRGETKKLTIENDLDGAKYRWASSKESVVTVDQNGTLTPVKKGKAKIMLYYTVNGKEYQNDSCTVTIK